MTFIHLQKSIIKLLALMAIAIAMYDPSSGVFGLLTGFAFVAACEPAMVHINLPDESPDKTGVPVARLIASFPRYRRET